MTKAKLVSALALTAMLGGALAATAQTGPGPRPEGPRFDGPRIDGPRAAHGMMEMGAGPLGALVWDEADTNGDGTVTAEEFSAALAARFASADTNGDGVLSPEELAAAIKAMEEARADQRRLAMATRILDRADDNGDGAVSADELRVPRAGADFVRRFDTDGDGVVTKAEYDAGVKKMTERARQLRERRGGAADERAGPGERGHRGERAGRGEGRPRAEGQQRGPRDEGRSLMGDRHTGKGPQDEQRSR